MGCIISCISSCCCCCCSCCCPDDNDYKRESLTSYRYRNLNNDDDGPINILTQQSPQEVCQRLWNSDAKLKPRTRQDNQGHYEMTPYSEIQLFQHVNIPNEYSELYTPFKELLNYFHAWRGSPEHYDFSVLLKQETFLRNVMETRVMNECYTALRKSGLFKGDYNNDFKSELNKTWFRLYGNNDECAFKHIFAGEKKNSRNYNCNSYCEATGLHNWYRFHLLESNDRITYRGPASNKVIPKDARVVTVFFEWSGCTKNQHSMFIGTSPAFEMALYTYLYIAGKEGSNKLELNGHRVIVDIHSKFEKGERRLLTGYPKESN